MSLRPYMTWSLQSLEDSQLSCTTKLETVVCSDVGHLSFKARLKEKKKVSEVKLNHRISDQCLSPVAKYCLNHPLTCVVRMQEGSEIAPKRRQLTLRRTEGSTGVSRKYRLRSMSTPRSTPGTYFLGSDQIWHCDENAAFPVHFQLDFYGRAAVQKLQQTCPEPEIEPGSTFWLLQSASRMCIMYNYKKWMIFAFKRL